VKISSPQWRVDFVRGSNAHVRQIRSGLMAIWRTSDERRVLQKDQPPHLII